MTVDLLQMEIDTAMKSVSRLSISDYIIIILNVYGKLRNREIWEMVYSITGCTKTSFYRHIGKLKKDGKIQVSPVLLAMNEHEVELVR